ncbi:MAG: hypothetical protein NXI20_14560 [bacterium]|nr:hypothetical protein [bacterium]
MRSLKFQILTIFITTLVLRTYAQPNNSKTVALLAKSTQSSIQLRWAPTTPVLWQLGNKYGYGVERITMLRNGKLLDPDDRSLVKLSNEILKPYPLESWEFLVENDDNAAIAAQAIYGTGFDFAFDGQDVLESINKVKEVESRFSFALYAADLSIDVAEYSGLYINDETISPEEKYIYRVYLNLPYEIQDISRDTVSYFIGLDDYYPLPEIGQFNGEFRDGVATLMWNYKDYQEYFTSYIIEKSSDNVDFSPITDQRITPAVSEFSESQKVMYYLDSLETNNIYYYRIKGISPFAEIGPPSEVISGRNRSSFKFSPLFLDADTISSQRVLLKWSFPENGMNLLKGFRILRSDNEGVGYQDISGLLSKQNYSYVDEKPFSGNYYIIEAVSIDDEITRSFPKFTQLEDNTPPQQPQNLAGKISQEGVVQLTWDEVPDSDLKGYLIYRKNFDHDEFIRVNSDVVVASSFADTIKLNNLTESIQYAIRAVDLRYNESLFSKGVKLTKPDLIPPVAPLIQNIQTQPNGVYLSWINSSSTDVIGYLLYRTIDGENWELVNTISAEMPSSIIDKGVEDGKRYDYLLVAMDDAGLESEPSDPVSIVFKQIFKKPELTGYVDEGKGIFLRWAGNSKQLLKTKIYRGRDETSMSLLVTADGQTRELLDQGLRIGNRYYYKIQLVYIDGSTSKFSSTLSLDY